VNADAIGFFRAEYDPATLSVDNHDFATLPDGDRIALLDDQWALVEARRTELPTYLALASAMGGDLDVRAWGQIAEALGTIEYDERGTPGHDAFAAYARSILKPVADRLGWAAGPDETPALQTLRRTVLQYLGTWGDQDVISEARKRFTAFAHDRSTISADDQSMVLDIVGLYADEATFDQLHELAHQSKDESALTRLYLALAHVRDPILAAKVAQIALSGELPPQQTILPVRMVAMLANAQPKLAWDTFAGHYELLLKPWGAMAPLALTQQTPQWFWNALPMDELQTWLQAHAPAGMDANIGKGMQAGRFKVSEKEALVPAADAYLAGSRP
jgi:aminopeptidase N